MCMKTIGTMTKCRVANALFLRGDAPILGKLATINRAFFGKSVYKMRAKPGLAVGAWAWAVGSRPCDLAFRQCSPIVPSRVRSCPGSLIPCPGRSYCLSRCFTKIRELAAKSQNPQNVYLVVNRMVSRFPIVRVRKTRGEKMKDSLAMLFKTNGGKMSVLVSLAMLLKKRPVISCLSRC